MRVEDRPHVGRRLLMTRRISLVAVCCSSDSSDRGSGLQLGEQPDVLDRDHRLVGEGLEEGDLTLREGLCLGATKLIVPIATPSRIKGTARTVR